MQQADCRRALTTLALSADQRRGRREFLPRGVHSVTGLEIERVPYKIVKETCTLTIDVLKNAGVLPGEQIPEELKPLADVTEWVHLGNRAVDVFQGCVRGERDAGWGIAGEHGGLGVFFWKTGSPKDREIKPAMMYIVKDNDLGNSTIEIS
ncbi:MAG: hypothetical protein LQ352_008097 [Teloschistes flavicans]|nr:MAG: hypothetical protein LQ352_008097 [Teloschistes flavicans]